MTFKNHKPTRLQNTNGFSLVEMSIVIVIAGFLLVTGLGLYTAYVNERRVLETYEKQRDIHTAIGMFSNDYQRLPCPADPSIPMGDPLFGVENCSLMHESVPIGECTNGPQSLCKVAGQRDTDADSDGQPDPVLIGSIPVTTLLALPTLEPEEVPEEETEEETFTFEGGFDDFNFESTLDSWGYQMSYAVSGHLTVDTTYQSGNGTIRVETETEIPLTIPEDSAHYVIVAHGNNHAGAYTLNGVQTYPCTTGRVESKNCDGDSIFVNGIFSRGDNDQYYDDRFLFSSYSISGIWEFFEDSNDIYNQNPGNVGIGVANPSEKLEVNENVRTDKLTQEALCANTGGDETCWSPDNLAGTTGISCPGAAPPGEMFVVQRIRHGNITTEDCVSVPMPPALSNQTCPPDEYVVGFYANGAIICEEFS